MSLRWARRRSPRRCVMSSPLKTTLPLVGSSRRITARPNVDLPQPDSPTRPTVSPVLISRSTPSTACTWPTTRCITPEETENQTLSSLTSTSGSAVVHARVSVLATASGTFELRPGLRDPARGPLRVANRLKRGHVARAPVDLECAPWMEGAPGGQVDEVRRQALDRLQRLVPIGVEPWDRAQQRPRVRVLGVSEHIDRRAGFDDA